MICLTGTKLKIRFIYVRFNCKKRKVGKCVCYVWTVCFYVFCGAGSVFCVFSVLYFYVSCCIVSVLQRVVLCSSCLPWSPNPVLRGITDRETTSANASP